jgi:hypothetical protein
MIRTFDAADYDSGKLNESGPGHSSGIQGPRED